MKTKTLRQRCIAGLSGLLLLMSACGNSQENEAAEETTQILKVRTEAPQVMTLSTESRYIGTVEAGSTVIVLPRVSAEILTTEFEVGDHVEEGDLLFTLDDEAARIGLSQAEAALATAQAGLVAAQCGYDAKEAAYVIQEATFTMQDYASQLAMMSAEDAANKMRTTELQLQIAVNTAYEKLVQARLAAGSAMDSYTTMESLYNRAVNKEYGDDAIDELGTKLFSARNSAESAAAACRMAQDAYDLAVQQQQDYLEFTKTLNAASIQADVLNIEQNAIISQESLDAAYSALEAAQAQVQSSYAAISNASAGVANAQMALGYYTVYSPVSGTIVTKNVTEHNMASPSQAAYMIETDEDYKVVFYVAERTMHEMSTGNTVTAEIDGAEYTGSIVTVSSVIDSSQGLYRVEALIGNDAPLAAGASVSLRTVSRQSAGALTVPSDSIYYDGEQAYLYVYEDGEAHIRNVTTGLEQDGRVEISEGLLADEQVIITWSSGLKDGTVVEIEEVTADAQNN